MPSQNTSAYPLESLDPGIIAMDDPQAYQKQEKFMIQNSGLLSTYNKKLKTLKGKELARKHRRSIERGNPHQLLSELDTYYAKTINGEAF